MIVKHNDDPMRVAVVQTPCESDEEYLVIAPSLLIGQRLSKQDWTPVQELVWP